MLSEDLRCSGGTVSNDFPVGCWNFSASHSLKTTKPTCIFCILKHNIHCNPSSPVAAIWPQNVWNYVSVTMSTCCFGRLLSAQAAISHCQRCVWCIPSLHPPLPERGNQECGTRTDQTAGDIKCINAILCILYFISIFKWFSSRYSWMKLSACINTSERTFESHASLWALLTLEEHWYWFKIYLENKLQLISINFTPKTSHSWLKNGILGFPGSS